MGQGSTVHQLKNGLDESTQAVRGIAHRISSASVRGQSTFAQALEDARGGNAVDVEREMVALADEQLRFEAASSLLQKVYSQIRSSVREG
jgi:flagellar basal body rod protein FlgB